MLKPIENKPIIQTRKMNFDFNDVKQVNFWGGNSIVSSYFAALSATFPPGEREFIDSVRLFKDEIKDSNLQQEIKGFIGQEGQHSYQHRKINSEFERLGWATSRIEEKLRRKIERQNRRRNPADRLAKTVCMEHVTAIMSEYILNHQEILEGLPDSTRLLFLWHTVEEIEHKSVTFDVYDALVDNRNRLRWSMVVNTADFVVTMFYYQVLMHVWAKSVPSWSDVKGGWAFFFGKRGMITNIAKPFRDFFKKDFHPWQTDNTDLVDAWKRSVESARTYPEEKTSGYGFPAVGQN